MKYSLKQLQKIQEVFMKNQAVFIGSTLGIEYLTDYDKFLLETYGINIDSLSSSEHLVNMFYFGMYSQYLGGNKSFKVKRKNFDKWLENEKLKPLSIQKKTALDFLKNRAFNDISGLGNRTIGNINNKIITASAVERNLLADKIKKETIKAVKKGYNQQKLASILREVTDDWSRDFSRISDYLLQESYAYGRLAEIIDSYGEDVKVYKQTFPGVCKYCEKNYGTPNEEPIIYTIQELMKNGNNIGRKEQLPVIGQAHPWARSILHAVPPNSTWNKDTKQFELVRNNFGVNRKSKAKVTITN